MPERPSQENTEAAAAESKETAERGEERRDDAQVAEQLESQVGKLRAELTDLETKKSLAVGAEKPDEEAVDSMETQIMVKKVGLSKMKVEAISSRIGKPEAAARAGQLEKELYDMRDQLLAFQELNGGEPQGASDAAKKELATPEARNKFIGKFQAVSIEAGNAFAELGDTPEAEQLREAYQELFKLEEEAAASAEQVKARRTARVDRQLKMAYKPAAGSGDQDRGPIGAYEEPKIEPPEIVQNAFKAAKDTAKDVAKGIWDVITGTKKI